jgi:hypothetical protein
MEKERIIEFLIGVCFIIFLILIVVLVLNLEQGKTTTEKGNSKQETQTVINNYYYENSNNYPERSSTGNVVYKYPHYNNVVYNKNYDSWDYSNYWNWDYEKRRAYWERINKEEQEKTSKNYYDFSSSGIRKKTKSGASYVDEYYVYVKNEDSFAKYFKVSMHFEDTSDPDGFEATETFVKYIRPGETRKFVFRDTHFERDHWDYWDYRVYTQDDGFEQGF